MSPWIGNATPLRTSLALFDSIDMLNRAADGRNVASDQRGDWNATIFLHSERAGVFAPGNRAFADTIRWIIATP
jgi:hypothetical protein